MPPIPNGVGANGTPIHSLKWCHLVVQNNHRRSFHDDSVFYGYGFYESVFYGHGFYESIYGDGHNDCNYSDAPVYSSGGHIGCYSNHVYGAYFHSCSHDDDSGNLSVFCVCSLNTCLCGDCSTLF